jgi:non-ribosomal peptide synthetase component F
LKHPSALLFDYGNTLLPFGAAQQRAQSDAMLGVLEAGACYVPLDPEWPEGRIAEILQGTLWLQPL